MRPSNHIDGQKMKRSRKIKRESSTYLVSNKTIADNRGMKGRYTGSLSKKTKRPHGEGRMEYKFLTYDGQWIDGDWTGFGTLESKHFGKIYQGGFFDNMKHGTGMLQYPDGRIYNGTFQFGRMKKGQMLYIDGSIFWGYYNSNSMPHGRGKLNFKDGSVFDGEFENGVIQGHGRMTWNDGRWYLGEWSNGEKNGHGIEVRSDGSICHEGNFVNGQALSRSTFSARRRSNKGCLLYPSSLTSDSPSILIGPLPKKRHALGRRFLNTQNRTNILKTRMLN